MFMCDHQEQSAAAWLAAAMNEVTITDDNHKQACRQSQTVQPLSRPNSRGLRIPASILRPGSAPVSPTGHIPSPPVSPNGDSKKIVRFADSAPGGQLECVKYYALSSVPIRRRSLPRAKSLPTGVTGQQKHTYFIKPTFANPSLQTDQFADRLHRQSVCLHSVSTTGADNTVYGLIAVRNHTYAKRVSVRYSRDDWCSAADTVADYSHTSCGADMFTFAIDCKPQEFTHEMTTGAQPVGPFNQRLHFVCRYETGTGDQYWDNNDGHDYCVNLLVNDYAVNTDL
ncbi:unnamed protein product [Medioppia subpectinata]|uniref:CBM21 domain-containing protein n=1 Tax=Medioppia subpectinata TaxID=1979941 RepID=A0A7R9PYA8_9ACAR|nr:unnamed protein product [Medioppia subpectinata]CAG2105889.1 unnamed protein product [Medioppia subpectinata]